jgi:uncharacterized membrane protein YobD (UPF0266 family)
MKKNMGTVDSIIRILIAAVIITLYVTNVITGTMAIVLFALAIVFILTGFIRFCPLYLPFGINTCKKDENKNS